MSLQEEMMDPTAQEVVQKLYLCDPKKNKECRKTCCYKMNMDPKWGECKYTTKVEYRANGHVYAYDTESKRIKEIK